MEREHDRSTSGLAELGRVRVRDKPKESDRRDRLRIHLGERDAALSAPTPDRARVQELYLKLDTTARRVKTVIDAHTSVRRSIATRLSIATGLPTANSVISTTSTVA